MPNTWVVTEGNPYKQWMEDYGGEHYQNAVRVGISKSSSYRVKSFTQKAFRNYRGSGTSRSAVTYKVRRMEDNLGAVHPT